MKKRIISKIGGLAIGIGLMAGAAINANAAIYWQNVTQNGNDNISDQISMGISIVGNSLTLTFKNNIGIASDITEIYIDAPPPGDGDAWFNPSTPVISQNVGTTFSTGNALNPGNPPGLGGGDWNFAVSAGVDIGPGSNGLNAATDVLGLTFTLANGVTLTEADVLQAIQNGTFRVAMHIRAIGTEGGSDTYLSGPPVPEPATVVAGALLLLPLGASAVRILRKNRAA